MPQGEVPHVYVVAEASAVAGRKAGSSNGEDLPPAVGLDQPTQDVRGTVDARPGSQLRVRSDRVEVAQRDHLQVGRRADVLQYLLCHYLRARVGTASAKLRGLVNGELAVHPVHRRGRAEDQS